MKVEVPQFDLSVDILNEEDIVALAGAAVAANISARMKAGNGALGALPRPKDGGNALDRTGQLQNSIGFVMKSTARKDGSVSHWAIVRALGDRSDRATRDANAKARQKKLRAAFVIGETMAQITTGKVSTARRGLKGRLTGGHLRSRSAGTNGALVAILSNPPRDQRSINGGRKVYVIFATNDADSKTVLDICKRHGNFRLAVKGR